MKAINLNNVGIGLWVIAVVCAIIGGIKLIPSKEDKTYDLREKVAVSTYKELEHSTGRSPGYNSQAYQNVREAKKDVSHRKSRRITSSLWFFIPSILFAVAGFMTIAIENEIVSRASEGDY